LARRRTRWVYAAWDSQRRALVVLADNKWLLFHHLTTRKPSSRPPVSIMNNLVQVIDAVEFSTLANISLPHDRLDGIEQIKMWLQQIYVLITNIFNDMLEDIIWRLGDRARFTHHSRVL
jgi:hypothetical protein